MNAFLKNISSTITPSKTMSLNSSFLIRMLLLPLLIVISLSLGTTVAHAELNANHQSSTVVFSGQHAGMHFDGKFERWQATLILPPESNPKITATFHMNSAKTGDSIYDSTLPEFDWFDVEHHALGTFVGTKITATKDGYHVSGDLTLKGITKPLSFMLTDNEDNLSANFDINRLAYQIGLESDPDAEWVSKTISISMLINK
jgi:polyisoprenoid-binding protein YceI